MAILKFLMSPEVKGRVGFDFYTEFVKRFQKSIDQIKLLKIIKEVIVSLACIKLAKYRKVETGIFASI
jgi:hypothetical protein